jgi:catechol 2,3-dioxygenase-like lactoylglutathione lyase family enzyme
MLKNSPAFSGFSVDDTSKAKAFYSDVLGVEVGEEPFGLELKLATGGRVFLYPKDDHQAATYTVLNFPVADIDKAVDDLAARGVRFERYEGFEQDERGIARDEYGPPIAWFTDPAGNILALIEQDRDTSG